MKKIGKALRFVAFICLIVLASVGVGLCGGVPIPKSSNRRDAEKDKIELIENIEKKSESEEKEIKG